MSDSRPDVLATAPVAGAVGALRTIGAPPRLLSANAIHGDAVLSLGGRALGTVDDLLLDLGAARIVYAVVSSGGFMGRGERLSAVPWLALRRDPDRHCFVLTVEADTFDAAPSYDRSSWPSRFDARWHQQLHSLYGLSPHWA